MGIALLLSSGKTKTYYKAIYIKKPSKQVTFDLAIKQVPKDSKVTEIPGQIRLNKPFIGIFELGQEKIQVTVNKS